MLWVRRLSAIYHLQVAGCTLDAGAKIYAGRVDSIYNDAFKMLGGLGRGGNNDEGDWQGHVHDCLCYVRMYSI